MQLIIAILTVLYLASNYVFGVPLPPGGRVAVHGWLILPIESDLPNPRNPSAPVEAWFSHHVPEFWQTSPHNFQIIVRGYLVPQSVVYPENTILPLNLPYPPKDELLGNEYTITPPPPFSLNDLIFGRITRLLGVVYNGSFDTPYERIADGIASFTIIHLTTVQYLNDSDSIVPYPNLAYLSYPRKLSGETPRAGLQHYYFAHAIRKAPDFDQIVHVTIDLASCTSKNPNTIYERIHTPGAMWHFNQPNLLKNRLAVDTYDVAQIVDSDVQCKVHVLEKIHCMVGPGFDVNC